MKILILGADGMLGHQLIESYRGKHETVGTYRRSIHNYTDLTDYLPDQCYYHIEATDFASIKQLITHVKPTAVINAIGIVKQRDKEQEIVSSIKINSLLPHQLADICQKQGTRLIHISTDCVFSGKRGYYLESDVPDAEDIYGRTKLLGEVTGAGCLTLRTSIIGLELSRKKSLIEWFLTQKDSVQGFRNAVYSGFTTIEMARIIEKILLYFPDASGLYHLSSKPIDKFNLLVSLNNLLGNPTTITENVDFNCDRSLSSQRFKETFNYTPPEWPFMLAELATQIKSRYQ